MQSHSSFLSGATFERRLRNLLAGFAFLATWSITGCQPVPETRQALPPEVERSLRIVGTDHDIIGHLNLSNLIGSFLKEVSSRLPDASPHPGPLLNDMSRMLDSLRADPASTPVSVHVGVDLKDSLRAGVALIDAALVENVVESWMTRWGESTSKSVQDGFQIYGIDLGCDSLFVGFVPLRSLLFSRTRAGMERMKYGFFSNRSISDVSDSEQESRASAARPAFAFASFDVSPLVRSIAGADAWLLFADVPALISNIPKPDTPDEVSRLMQTVEAGAMGVEIESGHLFFRVYLQPRPGVEASDIRDVLQGALAALRMNEDAYGIPTDILELPEVDVVDSLVRVRVDLPEDRFLSLLPSSVPMRHE